MILDVNDPILEHEVPEYTRHSYTSGTAKIGGVVLDIDKCIAYPEGYWMPDLSCLPSTASQAVYEKYEGIVFVDFVPTSENLSAWLLSVAKAKMEQLGVKVVAVEFWETPKSHCRVDV